MKILIVVSSLRVGGMERQAVLHATELTRRGHVVDVAVAYAGDPFEKTLRDAGIGVFPLLTSESRTFKAYGRALRVLPRLSRLRGIVREQGYDIVHGFGRGSNAYVSMATVATSSKAVWGVMDAHPLTSSTIRLLERATMPYSDGAVAVSGVAAEVIAQRGYPKEKIRIVHTGIDGERFDVDLRARDTVRTSLGVESGQLLVGTISRLVHIKGIETFVEACSLLAKRDARLKFLIMGPGNPAYVDELKDLAQRLGVSERMIWKGGSDEVERYYNALDAFVSASHSEGFANTPVEAMACGTPCVLTDVGDASIVAGQIGEVVPVRDAAAMADAVERVLANQQGWTRREVREATVTRFSAQVAFDHLERAYASILGEPDPDR